MNGNLTNVAERIISSIGGVNDKTNGMTPLQIAVTTHNFEMVKLLVENGANLDTKFGKY